MDPAFHECFLELIYMNTNRFAPRNGLSLMEIDIDRVSVGRILWWLIRARYEWPWSLVSRSVDCHGIGKLSAGHS